MKHWLQNRLTTGPGTSRGGLHGLNCCVALHDQFCTLGMCSCRGATDSRGRRGKFAAQHLRMCYQTARLAAEGVPTPACDAHMRQ